MALNPGGRKRAPMKGRTSGGMQPIGGKGGALGGGMQPIGGRRGPGGMRPIATKGRMMGSLQPGRPRKRSPRPR